MIATNKVIHSFDKCSLDFSALTIVQYVILGIPYLLFVFHYHIGQPLHGLSNSAVVESRYECH